MAGVLREQGREPWRSRRREGRQEGGAVGERARARRLATSPPIACARASAQSPRLPPSATDLHDLRERVRHARRRPAARLYHGCGRGVKDSHNTLPVIPHSPRALARRATSIAVRRQPFTTSPPWGATPDLRYRDFPARGLFPEGGTSRLTGFRSPSAPQPECRRGEPLSGDEVGRPGPRWWARFLLADSWACASSHGTRGFARRAVAAPRDLTLYRQNA
jgi:hypothetical protein